MKGIEIERAAYLAAHRILAANLNAPELAGPGARRSHAVDTIADIIRGILELHTEAPKDPLEWHTAAAFQRPPRFAAAAALCANSRNECLRERGKIYDQSTSHHDKSASEEASRCTT